MISTMCTEEVQAVLLALGTYFPNMLLAGMVWPLGNVTFGKLWFGKKYFANNLSLSKNLTDLRFSKIGSLMRVHIFEPTIIFYLFVKPCRRNPCILTVCRIGELIICHYFFKYKIIHVHFNYEKQTLWWSCNQIPNIFPCTFCSWFLVIWRVKLWGAWSQGVGVLLILAFGKYI